MTDDHHRWVRSALETDRPGITRILMVDGGVTRVDAEELFQALLGGTPPAKVHQRADELLGRATADPLIGRGLQTVYYATWPGQQIDPAEVLQAHRRWAGTLAAYDVDPAAWWVGYFRGGVRSFTQRFDEARGRHYGARFIRAEQLTQRDVDTAVVEGLALSETGA